MKKNLCRICLFSGLTALILLAVCSLAACTGGQGTVGTDGATDPDTGAEPAPDTDAPAVPTEAPSDAQTEAPAPGRTPKPTPPRP